MRLYLLVLTVVLAGCATQPQQQQAQTRTTWLPPQAMLENSKTAGLQLKARDGRVISVPARTMENLLLAKAKLEQTSGVAARLAIAESEAPNAFALTTKEGQRVIGFSTAWLENLGHDQDAIASTIGHELGHLYLGHNAAGRKEREATGQGISNVAGTIANQLIPFGGLLTSLAVTGVVRGFSRDEERAADDQGIRWAVQAGYDPCGRTRVMAMYQRLSRSGMSLPFLSTHPGSDERSETAAEYARRAGKSCDTNQSGVVAPDAAARGEKPASPTNVRVYEQK